MRPICVVGFAAMATTAACLQPRIFPPWLQISSSSSPTSQNVSLRIVAPSSSLGWVLSTSLRRFPVESRSGRARGGVTEVEEEEEGEEEDALALYEEELGQEEEEEAVTSPHGAKVKRTFRSLGTKEKKELRAYAHKLGNDICVHQVGKWGLTANCITAISDALEANELVKIRVLDNLDEEFDDTARQLEGETGAQIVGKVGRTLLLYRPSMRKLKAAQAAEQKAYRYQKRKSMLASRTRSSGSFPRASGGKR